MSEFWRRKIRNYFRKLDADSDGYLTRDDVVLIAGYFCKDDPPDSPRRNEALETYNKYFSLFEPFGSAPGRVTEQEWIDGAAKIRSDPGYTVALEDSLRSVFSILDSDGDGVIQEEEYTRFFYNFQIPDHVILAKKAFAALDTNGDGCLSAEEFLVAGVDFFTSVEETRPGTYLFGPFE